MGSREQALAGHLGLPVAEARALLKAHRRTYATFWAWSERATDNALLRGNLERLDTR